MSALSLRAKPSSLKQIDTASLKSKPSTTLSQSYSSAYIDSEDITPNGELGEFVEPQSKDQYSDDSAESATTANTETSISPYRKFIKRLSSSPGSIVPPDILSLLHDLPFFAGLDQSGEFTEQISKVLRLRKYQTGDVVITQGETAKAMFFIIKGLLTVVSDDGEIELAELTSGNYFGEIGIVFEVKRTATVVAKTPCILLTLTAEKVSLELNGYPEIRKNVLAIAQERLVSLAKVYEKSGKKISSDITRQIAQFGFAADIPTTLSVDQTRTHWLEDLKASEISNISLNIAEEDGQKNDMGDEIATLEKKDSFKPITSAHVLSKILTEKRRASVAVWSDAKLLDFAKNVVSQVPSKESRFAANLVSANSTMHLTGGPSFLDISNTDSVKAELCALDSFLIARILRFLDLDSLIHCRNVNNYFSNIIKDKENNLYASVNLSHYSKKINDEKLKRLLAFIGQNIYYLNLKNCWPITDIGLLYISQFCPTLVNLDLSNVWDITDVGLIKLAEVAQQLEAVNLNNCRKITDRGVLALLEKAPELRQIQVSYCKNLTGNVMNHRIWSTIQEINFQRSTNIRDDGFLNWQNLSANSNISYFALENLNLSDCSFLTDASIQVLGSKCPQLKLLCLSFCCSLTENFASFLVEGCPFIQVLDTSYCGGAMTDEAVKIIAQGLPRLHSLGLRGCVLLTDQGMEHLATHALALHTLNFTQCKNVSPNICKKLGIEWNCITTPVYIQKQ